MGMLRTDAKSVARMLKTFGCTCIVWEGVSSGFGRGAGSTDQRARSAPAVKMPQQWKGGQAGRQSAQTK